MVADQTLGEEHSRQWAGADKGSWAGVDHTLAEEAYNSVMAYCKSEAFPEGGADSLPCMLREDRN